MNEQARIWKKVLSEKVADCRVFTVTRDVCVVEEEEREATFYCIESADWCNILPVTKNGEVVLIEQFRHGIQQISLEIPGGIVDEGENPQAAAVRELLEETGYAPGGEVVSLGTAHPNPAIQNNTVYMFLALDCEKIQEPHFDATEHTITKLVPLADLSNLVQSGQITHSLVLTNFLRFFIRQSGGKL